MRGCGLPLRQLYPPSVKNRQHRAQPSRAPVTRRENQPIRWSRAQTTPRPEMSPSLSPARAQNRRPNPALRKTRLRQHLDPNHEKYQVPLLMHQAPRRPQLLTRPLTATPARPRDRALIRCLYQLRRLGPVRNPIRLHYLIHSPSQPPAPFPFRAPSPTHSPVLPLLPSPSRSPSPTHSPVPRPRLSPVPPRTPSPEPQPNPNRTPTQPNPNRFPIHARSLTQILPLNPIRPQKQPLSIRLRFRLLSLLSLCLSLFPAPAPVRSPSRRPSPFPNRPPRPVHPVHPVKNARRSQKCITGKRPQ